MSNRRALCIGNSLYDNIDILINAHSDAIIISKMLELNGFRVELASNLTCSEMRKVLKATFATHKEGDEILVYMSGHGFIASGNSYLLGVDATLSSISVQELTDKSLGLKEILDELPKNSPRVIVFDACRTAIGATDDRTFIELPSDGNVLAVIYSAGLGERSIDNPAGLNSFFGEAFARHLAHSESGLADFMGSVEEDVREATGLRQSPKLIATGKFGRYFLNRKGAPHQALQSGTIGYSKPKFPIITDSATLLKMAILPAGEFDRGSPERDRAGKKNEFPPRRVRIPKSFGMTVYPITVKQWNRFMPSDPIETDCDQKPAVSISWYDAVRFGKVLTQNAGHINLYRLCTEAEWEYACRSGLPVDTTLCTEDEISVRKSLFDEHYQQLADTEPLLVPVDQMATNSWGLVGMRGNVWEWVQDCYAPNYTNAPIDGAAYSDSSNFRVLRGGDFLSPIEFYRPTMRSYAEPDLKSPMIGFRLVCELGRANGKVYSA